MGAVDRGPSPGVFFTTFDSTQPRQPFATRDNAMTLNTLFRSQRARANTPSPATTVNEAGGIAYERSPRLALATYATTGCLAALVPALRAAKVDPASSLRAD